MLQQFKTVTSNAHFPHYVNLYRFENMYWIFSIWVFIKSLYTKASTSSITSHINNTCAQILKCVTHAISFKGNHYNPTLVTFKMLI